MKGDQYGHGIPDRLSMLETTATFVPRAGQGWIWIFSCLLGRYSTVKRRRVRDIGLEECHVLWLLSPLQGLQFISNDLQYL